MNDIIIDKEGLVQSYAMAKKDQYLYFSDINNKGLIRLCIKTGKVDFLNIFLSKGIRAIFWQAFEFNNEIWFIPLRDDEKKAIYNILYNKFEYLKIPKSSKSCAYRPFEEYVIRKDSVYLIPKYYDCMLKINLITRQVMRIDIGISQYAGNETSIITSSITFHNNIYFCPYNNDNLLCYDMDNEQLINLFTGVPKEVYTKIFIHNSKLILTPKEFCNPLFVYDIETGEREIKDITPALDVQDAQYNCGFIYENLLILFPYHGSYILTIDIDTFCISTNKIRTELIDEEKFGYCKTTRIGNVHIISTDNINYPMLIFKDNIVKQFRINYPKDYFITLLMMEIEKNEKEHS